MKASKRMRGMMNEMRVARLRCGKNLWCRIQSRESKLPFCMVLEGSADAVVVAYLECLVVERCRHP